MRLLLAMLVGLAIVRHSVAAEKQSPSVAPLVQAEFIYETAPFPECHASTLVETKTGLVCAWFGGEREQHPSVGIWQSRQIEGKWSVPVEVADGNQSAGNRLPCWNPVLFQPQPGLLLLFYKVGPSPQTWWGELKRSTDEGRTWSAAEKLPEGVLGPIKNKPVRLANGEILCPTSTETPGQGSAWRVHFERTADLGRTWEKVAPSAAVEGEKPIDAIQPSILFHPHNQLQAVGRTRSGKVFETWSKDGGRTWSAIGLTSLPNPNSGTDAVTLKDGRQLLVYNHTSRGRSPLNVAVSQDGKMWQAAVVLEKEPGEYSYPAVIQTADERIHVTYTWKRQKVKHVVLDPAKIDPQPIETWNR